MLHDGFYLVPKSHFPEEVDSYELFNALVPDDSKDHVRNGSGDYRVDYMLFFIEGGNPLDRISFKCSSLDPKIHNGRRIGTYIIDIKRLCRVFGKNPDEMNEYLKSDKAAYIFYDKYNYNNNKDDFLCLNNASDSIDKRYVDNPNVNKKRIEESHYGYQVIFPEDPINFLKSLNFDDIINQHNTKLNELKKEKGWSDVNLIDENISNHDLSNVSFFRDEGNIIKDGLLFINLHIEDHRRICYVKNISKENFDLKRYKIYSLDRIIYESNDEMGIFLKCI